MSSYGRRWKAKKRDAAELIQDVTRLFAEFGRLTSSEIAAATGHYCPSDAVCYLRFHGMRLAPVTRIRGTNGKLYELETSSGHKPLIVRLREERANKEGR